MWFSGTKFEKVNGSSGFAHMFTCKIIKETKEQDINIPPKLQCLVKYLFLPIFILISYFPFYTDFFFPDYRLQIHLFKLSSRSKSQALVIYLSFTIGCAY